MLLEAESLVNIFWKASELYVIILSLDVHKQKSMKRKFFGRMDEPNFFEVKQTLTVYPTKANTVSITGEESIYRRCTACIAVASDGTKMFLYVGLKEQPTEYVERNLHNILSVGRCCCCQAKPWIDKRCMKLGQNLFESMKVKVYLI